MEPVSQYTIKTRVDLPVGVACEKVKQALADEGFGVLTEIDMAGTLKAKTGASIPPYILLGACNPTLAEQALRAEADIGVLLPCNVAVYELADSGGTVVAAIDPVVQLGVTGLREVEPIAADVRSRLERVIDRLGQAD